MLRKELRSIPVSPRRLRSFGLLVGSVFVVIAGLVYWRGGWGAWVLLGMGTPLVGLGFVRPAWLRPIYVPWMALALILGFIMTRVLLTVVFIGLIVPTGLIMRAVGRDPLKRRWDREAKSYWSPVTRDGTIKERLERYY